MKAGVMWVWGRAVRSLAARDSTRRLAGLWSPAPWAARTTEGWRISGESIWRGRMCGAWKVARGISCGHERK